MYIKFFSESADTWLEEEDVYPVKWGDSWRLTSVHGCSLSRKLVLEPILNMIMNLLFS